MLLVFFTVDSCNARAFVL